MACKAASTLKRCRPAGAWMNTRAKVHKKPRKGASTKWAAITFPLVLKYVDEMQTVSEQAIMEAVKWFFYRMKLVFEPSGALGLAALLAHKIDIPGRIGIIIISGGNIDADTLSLILNT